MDREKFKDLVLAMLFVASWEDKEFGESITKSWKGYPFELLNELEDEEMIFQTRRSKSVTLSDSGKEKAKRILEALEAIEW